MLEMKCPGCGAGGGVPREKKNTRLVCKKCLKVFHLSPSGQPMLGEPPEPKDLPKERAVRESSGADFSGSFDDLTSKLGKIKLPNVSLPAVGIVAAVVLVGGLGFLLLSKQSLETRAKRIATALKDTEYGMKTVTDLSYPGTEMDGIRWFYDSCKRYGDLKIAMAGLDPRLQLKTLSDGSSGPAVVVAQFTSEGTRLGGTVLSDTHQPTPSLSNSGSQLEFPLYLVKDNWGNWLLDAKRTAEGVP